MAKVGRNDKCTCGSGKKFKNCCEGKSSGLSIANWVTLGAIAVAVGVLVYVVFFAATNDGTTARTCPPGQVWSSAHGHCH